MTQVLFVGNLPLTATEQSLTTRFNKFGTVLTARLHSDPTTGRSRHSASVEMRTAAEAQRAINGLNRAEFEGRVLTVHAASGTAGVNS